jgi:hypothetical protein
MNTSSFEMPPIPPTFEGMPERENDSWTSENGDYVLREDDYIKVKKKVSDDVVNLKMMTPPRALKTLVMTTRILMITSIKVGTTCVVMGQLLL